MKGYGEDTESENGIWRENNTPGCIKRAIQLLDDLYPDIEKGIRRYFSKYPRTKVNSIVREGWQVTCQVKVSGAWTEVEWCRIKLVIAWPSAVYEGYPNLFLHWNIDLQTVDPERYGWTDTESFKRFAEHPGVSPGFIH